MKNHYYLVVQHADSSNSSHCLFNLKEARARAKEMVADTERFPTMIEVRICNALKVGAMKERIKR